MSRPDRKLCSISRELLRISRDEVRWTEFLNRICQLLLEQSGCDGIGIMLEEDGTYRRCTAAHQDPPDPTALAGTRGAAKTLEDLSRDLLTGALVPSGRRFTPAGSFYTGAADRPVQLTTTDGGRARYSLGGRFKSVALIPFDLDQGQTGLLVLGSARPRSIRRAAVELQESIAQLLGVTIVHRRVHDDLRRLEHQLRHADRLATIGQLSAGVAHEINEPLGSILGFAQLARKHPEAPDQVRRDIDRIIDASLHAREVIGKLMLLARQTPPQKTWVDINVLIQDGLYFLESRCAKAGIALRRELAPDLPEVTADPGQLYQVLINLAVNAVQAMPDGGTLTLRTAAAGGNVSLVVEDTGVGMSEEVRSQVFLPFFTTKDVGEGTGLGLAVADGIVKSHDGRLRVESEPGAGARFTVTLPVSRPAPDVRADAAEER